MTTVGIVTEWFERGSAHVTRAMLKTLTAAGFDIALFVRGEHIGLQASIWDFDRLTTARECHLPNPKAFRRSDFVAWLTKETPDVIIFNEQAWICPVQWANSFGIPTIAFVDYYTRESIKDMKHYSRLICNTKRHMAAMSWHQGAQFIPWGTDLSKFRPQHTSNDKDMKPITFVHSAGWNPYRKGTDQVLRAFSRLESPYVRLVIAHQCSIDELRRLVLGEEEVLSDPRLTLLPGDQGPDLYSRGDVYVYPSRLDGIGLTQAEALASGLPLIVPDEPPMAEFGQAPHSQLVPVQSKRLRKDRYYWPEVEISTEDLTSAMRTYILNERRAQWRSDCREYAEAALDWTKNSTALVSLVEDSVAKGPRVSRQLGPFCQFAGWLSDRSRIELTLYSLLWRATKRFSRLMRSLR